MMFVDLRHEARPSVQCLLAAGRVLDAYFSCRSKTQLPGPDGRLDSLVGGGEMGRRSGCAQCAHLGPRTVPYRCRTGPDFVCFGGSSVFASPGTRFDSHLGHSVSAVPRPVSSLGVDKTAQSVDSGVPFSVWPAFANASEKDATASSGKGCAAKHRNLRFRRLPGRPEAHGSAAHNLAALQDTAVPAAT
jgi:hypothetical protein